MRKCVLCHYGHPRSLISVFVVRCLDSIISLYFMAEISRLWLASVAAQAGLILRWSETPEDIFSHGVAQMQFKVENNVCIIGLCVR